MKNAFRAYYQPTPSEMEEIWGKGLLILDTNALLHLFRYSPNAREDFFKALEAKQESLWLPHQVGAEFHRHRIEIINAQDKAFDEIESVLAKASGQVKAAFDSYKRHPSLNISQLNSDFAEAVQALKDKLKQAHSDHKSQMIETKTNDVILAKITNLYDSRVGPAFDDGMLSEIYAEGSDRYERKIPPGYEDAKKSEPAKYGDLVLWKQILKHASEVKLPAVFVTDDRKEDWWYTVDSHRHGARPELVEEYFEASGERIHVMTSDRFLDFAKTQMVGIRQESVSEAEMLSRDYARNLASGNGNSETTSRNLLFELLAGDPGGNLGLSRDQDGESLLEREYLEAREVLDHLTSGVADARENLEHALEHFDFDEGGVDARLAVAELQRRLNTLEIERTLARDRLQNLMGRRAFNNVSKRTSRGWSTSLGRVPLFQVEHEDREDMLFNDGEEAFKESSVSAVGRSILGKADFIEPPLLDNEDD